MTPPQLIEKLLPKWSPTMYKATLGGLVVLAIAIPLALAATPFIEFFNGMAAQPKGKAQMTVGRIYGAADLVERPPVEGMIPRGYFPYEFDKLGNTIEDAKRVGEQLANPVPITMSTLQEGRERFNTYCITCHGERGEGNGSVTGPGRYPAPPSLHTEQALGYRDGTVYHIISKGVGKMPGYADKLEPEERWAVIHYLRALQRSMAPRPEDLGS
ncbi:MAG: cytochrome c [Phycisphaerales bacterium]|nr:MAG: cytochrome c [Phycisphaerales bacterium]